MSVGATWRGNQWRYQWVLGILGFSVEENSGPDWVWQVNFFFHVAVFIIFF